MGLGFGELLIILVIVLVLFGANRLPAMGEGLGKAIRGFKDALRSEPPKDDRRPPPGAPTK
jgi:sec-independent protein translocase protein TatA